MRRSAALIIAIILLLASVQSGLAQTGQSFKLLPQTRIKISVVEWIAAQGDYKEWTALAGEYIVETDGTVSVPIVGTLQATDQTTNMLAGKLAKALQANTGLTNPPTVSIQVLSYPPIYVSGDVERPGEVAFMPGLTVMQAVALAGGRDRRTNAADRFSALDQIRYVGELNRVDLDTAQQLARRSRLYAELADEKSIAFAPEFEALIGQPAVRQIKETELVLFKTRTEALARQLSSLNDLGELLKREVSVLNEKMSAQDRQITIAQEELKTVSKLVKQRTVTRSRQTGLERIVADLESSKLDMIVASMRAKQKLSETIRDSVSLRGQRQIDVSRELQLAETQLEELQIRRATLRQLLLATGALIEENANLAELENRALSFSIVRKHPAMALANADGSDLLAPGDLLQVSFSVNPKTKPVSFSALELSQQSNVGGAKSMDR